MSSMTLPKGTLVTVESGTRIESYDTEIFSGILTESARFVLLNDYVADTPTRGPVRITTDFVAVPFGPINVSGTVVNNMGLACLLSKNSVITRIESPSSPVDATGSEDGMPMWGWGLVALGGIGVLYLVMRD